MLACLRICAGGPLETFDDIEFSVGDGPNRAAMAIDWDYGDEPTKPALVWGFRWEGEATGEVMLRSIAAADDRLFVKLNAASGDLRVYGIGYDADNDGEFAISDGTQFSADGIGFGSAASDTFSVDVNDYYAEGWLVGQFWHYGAAQAASFPNPQEWASSQRGLTTRMLTDQNWDSWALSPLGNFSVFADYPLAAAAPGLLGDFNGNGVVDAADYVVWRNTMGSTTNLAADANANNRIDDGDYDVWKANFGNLLISSARTGPDNVPEPACAALLATAWLVLAAGGSRGILQSVRGCRSRLTAICGRQP